MKKNEQLNLILDKIKSGEELNFEAIKDKIYQNNDFSEISGLFFSISAPNAQKRKYFNSIILSKMVFKIVEWFKTAEGEEWMNSKNVLWSNEEIGNNIFGWQKSYFYKLLKMGQLSDEVLIAFDKHCETHIENGLNRTIENLLRFAKTYNLQDDNINSVLKNELDKLREIVTYQRQKFISPESVQLVDEVVSKIDSIISSLTTKTTENSHIIKNNHEYQEETLSKAREHKQLRMEIIKEFSHNKMNPDSKKISLEELRAKIKKGNYSKTSPHFGGANLIITDNPTYIGLPHDKSILTEHASELSWLVFELKEIFKDQIDHLNKYKFYPSIGYYINEAFGQKKNLPETMLYIIDKLEKDWH